MEPSRTQFFSRRQKDLDEECTKAKERVFRTTTKDGAETLRLGDLLNFCYAKISKYEFETRARASWSFGLAVVAMLAGFGILCWGAYVLFHAKNIIPGSIISAVGGAMSAYIAKTFLDIHRVSLQQLNHYFKQPVLSSHILSAQRLADRLDDDTLKKEMYRNLIDQVIALIPADEAKAEDIADLGSMHRVPKSKMRHHVLKKLPNGGKPESLEVPTGTSEARR